MPADSPDEVVFSEAIRQKRTIVSRDKHFGNILLYPPHQHYGAIILRTQSMNSEAISNILIGFLRKTGSEDYRGKIYIIKNDTYRKRESVEM